MSSKDMFRKEQRFSFRKFSFGLASAVIANVIFGGAIASSPIVHANTAEPTSTVVPSERLASVSYTVNVVDQAGTVINTQAKNVSVQTTEATAVATANLTTDLVPEGYALVSGLGQVTVTENAENVFTVVIEKATSEVASTEDSAAVSASETSTTAATSEETSTATSETVSSTTVAASETSTKATSEVANTAAVAVAAAETVPNKTERTAYLSYITHYVNEANETVDRTGHLVAVKTTDETAKTQVTVSASENMPSGWELVQDKAKVVVQLVENQTNVLVFAVTKKSKEEEVAESQLANKDVLEQVLSEGVLLSNDAARLLETSQAGNTGLEVATNNTKAVLKEAIQVFDEPTSTQEQVDAQTELVRAASKTLADELLKFDEDGVLTAMLDATTNQAPTITASGTGSTNPFNNPNAQARKVVYIFGTTVGDTEALTAPNTTATGAAPFFDRSIARPVATITDSDSTSIKVNYGDGVSHVNNLGNTMVATDVDGTVVKTTGGTYTNVTLTNGSANIYLGGTYNHGPGGKYTRQFIISDESGTEVRGEPFYTVSYTDKLVDRQPIVKLENTELTETEVLNKLTLDAQSGGFRDTSSTLTVPESEVTRTIVGYRVDGTYTAQTDLAQFPKDKDLEVKVKTTNVYGQTVYNWVSVDYNLKPTMPTIGVNPGTTVKNGDNRQLEALFVFGNVTGTTEAVSTSGNAKAPDFGTSEVTRKFLATDPENDAVTISYGVPGNVTEYVAGNPDSVRISNSANNPISAPTKSLGNPNNEELIINAEGKLTGKFSSAPGGFYSRVVKMTDTAGNVSYSNPFFVVGYTDKLADNADLTVAAASDLTEANIFGKLTIDVTSGSGNTNRSLTVPTSEYTRKIVGYRFTGTTAEQTLSTATLNTLPAGKNYQIKVETTNPYGQTIYNWVPVNDTRTVGIDKSDLYVFKGSPIQTVAAGTYTADNVDKVKVVTVEDKDGVDAISYYQSPSNRVSSIAGIMITPEAGAEANQSVGYATGTPTAGVGVYSRSFGVTDGNNKLEFVNTNVNNVDNRQATHIMDATADGTLKKQAGETVTKDEILAKVKVNTGNSNTVVADPTTMYKMDLAPGEIVPTAPGEYDVKVRVVTLSNVYKDVVVKVIIDKYADTLTATAAENTSLVPGSGTAATQPIVINDANGAATTAPAGTTYAIDPAFKAEKEALGYEISVSPTGEVSVKAPAGQESDIAVPVTVTYPDKTTDSVSVPFKVNQKDTAQLKAKEAIDKKLADETKALEDKKNAEIAAITNNPDLTPDQKDAAVKDITDAAEIAKKALNDAAGVAKDNVDAATTPEEAKAAQTAGETTLANLENGAEAALDLITAKAEAKDAIADKLADEVKELEAKQAEAEKAIDASTMTPEEKDAAKKALQDVVDAEKAKLEDAAKKATDAVDAATTPADVKAAEIAGETALTEAGTKAEEPIDLIIAKTEAKDAIADKLADEVKELEAKQAEAEKAIDASSMTPEEKAAAKEALQDVVDAEKAKLEDAAKKATDAVDAATTPADVKAAEIAGETALTEAGKNAEAAVDLAKDKELAKEAIRTEAEEATKAAEKLADDAIKAINDNPNLTDDEKKAAIDKVNDAAKVALDTIADNAKAATEAAENAQALADLETAKKAQKDADKVAIDTATPLVDAAVLEAAKQDALNKLEDDAAKAKETIAANPNLSDKEVDKALADLEKDLAKAKDAVNTATTPEAVQTAEDKGVDVIAGDVLAAAQLDALNKLEDDTKETIAAIEANPNLTEDEKKAAIAKAEDLADDAKSDIMTAETPEDVQAVEEKADKDLAKEELKAATDDAKKAIDANPNLTPDEKKVAKDALDAEVAKATDAIDKAATPADVNAATLAGEKELAKAEVAAATDDAKKAIDANPNLSPDEKQAAKDALDKEVEKATDAIDTATTPADVNAATLAGEKVAAKAEVAAAADDAIAAINANPNLDEKAKAEAVKAVEDAAKTATDAIDAAKTPADVNATTLAGEQAVAKAEVATAAADAVEAIKANPNLDDTAKAAAIKAVEDAAKTATDAIDAAKTPADVNAATLAGEQAVAKAEVATAAADAKAAIDANANLTADEKAVAKAAVDAELAKANDAIDAAKTADAVAAATLAGEQAVAKEELKAAAADTKKAIDAHPNLTAEEKAAAKAAVDAELAKATAAIAAATTADAVAAAKLEGEKAVAKEELKAAAADAKAAIDANANLTAEEKVALKAAVDAELAKATVAVDAGTTAAAVDAATLLGEQAVAKEELKAAAADAKAAIDANANLTAEEKQAAKDAVDAELAKSTDAIDNAKTTEEVESVTLAGDKALAKEEIKAAADDAKKAIDANPNLSDAEKQAARDAVDASAAAANKAIDGSTSSVEVQAAKDKGNAAIAENVLDAAKQGAKNKLMEEADKAKAAIDANPNLTPEEKAAAKAEIDKAVEEAIIAINGAGTHHALGEIKLPLSALIKPVVTVTPVLDPNNLTEEEIARIKALLEENNTFPEGTEIIVSKGASVSIKYPDGTIDLVLPAEVVKQADTTAPAITDDAKGNIVVAPSEEAIELVVTYVDNNGKAQLVVVTKGADGKWTTTDKVVIVDPITGQVIIPGSAIKPGTVVTAYSKDMAGNVSDLNSAEVEAVDANNPAAGVKVKSVTSTSNANKSTKKAKQLPNTGEKATSATSLGLAVLGMGLALFAAKRKKDEEEA